MTTIRHLLVALVMCLALPTLAKGPETATLEGPGIVQPIVFLDQRRMHGTLENEAPLELMGMTGLYGRGLTEAVPPEDLGPVYTLTWVNMGTNDVIVQYLYPDAGGGPVLRTPTQEGLEGWGANVTGWFEAPDQLGEAISDVVMWATTPQGISTQPSSPHEAAGSASIWVIVAVLFAIGCSAISRAGYLGRAGVDELA